MSEQEMAQQIADLQRTVDAIYISTEKTRKYFKWTLITSVVVFVLPLLVFAVAAPSFFSAYTQSLQDPTDPASAGQPSALQQELDLLTK